MIPYVYRVLMKDNFRESDGAASKWTEDTNGAQITITSKKYAMAGATAAGICAAHWTQGVTQTKALEFSYVMNMSTLPGTSDSGDIGIFINGSASSGAGYGNSYYCCVHVAVDAHDAQTWTMKIYESSADVLTARASHTLSALSTATDYAVKWTYDPTTGAFVGYIDGTSEVTWVDTTPYTAGTYIALRANKINAAFTKVRARRPADTPNLTDLPQFIQAIGRFVSTFKFLVIPDTDHTTEWVIGDGVEIEWPDQAGQGIIEELDGRVEKVVKYGKGGLWEITGRDWRAEAMCVEGAYSAGANKNDAIMINIIDNCLSMLKSGDVPATSDAASTPTFKGRTAFERLISLGEQCSLNQKQGFWRDWTWFSAYAASGITIDEDTDSVVDAKIISESGSMANKITVYHGAVGSMTADTETITASRGVGMNSDFMVVDKDCDTAHAAALASYLISCLAGDSKIVDVWVADYQELLVGQAVTCDIATIGVADTAGIVVEKEFGGPDTRGLLRFRVVLAAYPRLINSIPGMNQMMDRQGKTALSHQI